MSYENFSNRYLCLMQDKGARLALVLVALLAVMGCSRVRSTATEIAPATSALTTANAPANTGAQTSYADVVARVAPAVVTVRAEQRVRAAQQHPFVDDPFFRQFFGDRAPREQQQPQIEHVLGSGVIVTPDLGEARIYVSVLGSEKKRKATLAGLESARGVLQAKINRELSLRRTPTLSFAYDDSVERGVRMTKLIDELAAELPDERDDD